jgi:branched-chain amino acid transport system substrate-binding protein
MRAVRKSLSAALCVLAVTLTGCGTVPHLARAGEQDDGSGGPKAKACQAGAPGITGDAINIGVNTTATGKAALTGQYAKIASDLAVKEINDSGGVRGKKLNLIYEDNQSTNPGAVNALRRSLTQDDVFAVLGPITSTQVQAMLPVVKGEKVPMLIGATNNGLTNAGEGVLFRLRPPDSRTVAGMVSYAADDLGARKIAVLRDSDSFGTGAAAIAQQEADRRGLVTKMETFTNGDTDYTGQLVSLRDWKPDALILLTTGANDAAIISRQVNELGLKMPKIGSVVYSSAATLKVSKQFEEGFYGAVDFLPAANEKSKAFSAAFQQQAGTPPDLFSGWVYDAVRVIADAINRSNCDRPDFRKALLQTKSFNGVQGPITAQSNGDMNHNVFIVQMHNGKPELVKAITDPVQ